jgi:8-oxo-dGTP pyrophosphatase MutT (NUDIX family)
MSLQKIKKMFITLKNRLNHFPEQGASLLLYADTVDKILLIQRNIDPLYGYWDIPGGARDDGESFKDCALREFSEELCGGKNVFTLLQPYIELKGENPKLTSFWLYYCPFRRKRCWKIYILHLREIAPVNLFNPNFEVKQCNWFKINRLPKPVGLLSKLSICLYFARLNRIIRRVRRRSFWK